MKLAHLLEHSAALFPGRIAVSQYERSITYGQLWQAVEHLDRHIRDLSLPGSSRIAVLWENSIEYAIAYFAVTRADHVLVPLDTSANPLTINSILSDADVRVLICQSRYQRHLPKILGESSPLKHIISDRELKVPTEGIARHAFTEIMGDVFAYPESSGTATAQPMTWDDSPNDLAAVFYTSGSTGAAKGVMLSHRNLVSNTLATVEYLRLTAEDSVMVILPFYYIYGNSLLLTH
ncbi:MAG: acyl--CoA ligase, partial [candidate division Zixibacteria bacterium]|nr:acyl--CoA ligase [candidate division Zixibacteria bacterium]